MNIPMTVSSVPALSEWWREPRMVSLVRRTAAADCNTDEFDEFVSVCKDLRLSPLRKQIYAFVFNKDDEKKRSMVIVVGIDGARAVAARTGCYRPDNKGPRFIIDSDLISPANPNGLVSAEVSAFLFSNGAWHEIVGVAHWDEFAPIVNGGSEDDYEWIDTGEKWPDSGKPKKKKRLKAGVTAKAMVDPKKDGWRKSGRHMLAKCAEMIALRKGWPEDLSRIYAEEETHRSQVIDAEYEVMTPSELATRGEQNARMERIGGPCVFATFDEVGNIERVPFGKFADRFLEVTKEMPKDKVGLLLERNREALNEFWAHSKTDALELKKELERRAAA